MALYLNIESCQAHLVMSLSMAKLGSSGTRPSDEGVENWE